MLFNYKYINHDITKLQKWIDFLFINVWCEAQEEFSFELLKKCPELKSIAEKEAYKEDPGIKKIDYLTGPISVIYDIFKDDLSKKDRGNLKKLYKKNTNIDKICENTKLYKPISISVLESFSKKLSDALYKFYVDLYKNVIDLAVIKNINGDLKNHYNSFVKDNNKGICPFCGIKTLRSYAMKGHESYDHYLPKENYPLYAINFKNLVPTCHDCNSIHKIRQSPILKKDKQTPRKAYYPYSEIENNINISIKINFKKYKYYEHKHIDISIETDLKKEELSTWLEVYNIKERYKDVLTNEGVGKYWLVEYLEEMSIETRGEELKRLPNKLNKSRYKDKNFLKVPFLLACDKEGLFK